MDLPPGTAGWQTLGITLPLPRHARSVVLFFGVRVPDKNARTYPFYLDDVRVTLVTSLAPP